MDKIENIEIFGLYLGTEDIKDNVALAFVTMESFLELRSRVRRELKALYRIAKHIRYAETHKLYMYTADHIAKKGLGLAKIIHGNTEAHFGRDYLCMDPLMYISRDYRNAKIHALELELCYINKNIKTLKARCRSSHMYFGKHHNREERFNGNR